MLINCVAEKTNARNIRSVAFSPDGTKIVSGSWDKTIKVWDVGVCKSPQIAPPRPKLTLVACLAGTMELLSEETDAHCDWIRSVACSPDGNKIVSGSDDKTIKLWESGALQPSNRPSLAKSDAC